MHLQQQITDFLARNLFAVAGASINRQKYGNKVLRCYLQHNRNVVPINPHATVVEGISAVDTLHNCDVVPDAVSIITPPSITETIVRDAIALGIQHLWMQPGAESETAIAECKAAGCNVISGGPCLLVVLGYSESGQ